MATLPYQVIYYPFGKPQDKQIEYFAKPGQAVKFAVSVLRLGSSPLIERQVNGTWTAANDLISLMAQQMKQHVESQQKKGVRELERLIDLATILKPAARKGQLDREQKLELLQAIIAVHKSLDLEPAPVPEQAKPPVGSVPLPQNVKQVAPNAR